MKAGRLRHRVRIERPVQSTDAYGAPTKTWEVVAEVPADINYISGREFVAASRDIAEATIRVYIRTQPPIDVDPVMRLINVDTGAEMEISAVLRNYENTMLTIMCRSGSKHS